MNETFTFPARLKTISIALMVVGLIALVAGFAVYGTNSNIVWANLLLNGVFFLSIGMGGAFFMAAHYLAWGGWSVVVKRVPEAIVGWMPVAAVILLFILIFGTSHLYEWSRPEVWKNDPIIAGKHGYLNLPFFYIRFAIFLGVLITTAIMMRRASLKEDTLMPGDISMYKRNLNLASVYIPFFAVYILTSAWDWLMSLDVHWYSTMYGWYAFASFWVTSIAVVTLIVVYLKKTGYLKEANENHLHNLGLMMFAFSVFWTYVTFCQFMLIWYANIPEETVYFQERYGAYKPLFYLIFILNFCCPFLILMSRDAKRKMNVLIIAACIIIVGHFLDFYLMIMPASIGTKPHFSFLEIGLPLFFIGAFIFVVFNQLTKASLVPKNHPFLQESIHHTI